MIKYFPNILTYSRLAITPLIAFLLIKQVNNSLCVILFMFCCATDYFDGFVAKKWGLTSPLGGFLDAFADKILITTITLALISLQAVQRIHLIPCTIIIWRELFISSIRMIPSTESTPSISAQWPRLKTLSQMLALLLLIHSLACPEVHQWGLIILWVSSLLTISSMQHYWPRIKHLFTQCK